MGVLSAFLFRLVEEAKREEEMKFGGRKCRQERES